MHNRNPSTYSRLHGLLAQYMQFKDKRGVNQLYGSVGRYGNICCSFYLLYFTWNTVLWTQCKHTRHQQQYRIKHNLALSLSCYSPNLHYLKIIYLFDTNRIGYGYVMVSVVASSAVYRGFEPRSGKTKDYKIGTCCFSAKYAADWLARNQDSVSK